MDNITHRHGAPIPDTNLGNFLLLTKEARRWVMVSIGGRVEVLDYRN
jgi:hypothetical protein